MNHQINIDEAIAIAKEYHLETEVTECIKQGMSPIEALTADYVVKWIKRRIDSKSSPHFTIEVKSDTEVTFKVHKKVQFNQ